MKCQVCGAESGKYPLCRACNQKREMGEVIKCELCGNWHYKDAPCKTVSEINSEKYLYDLRGRLISRNEAEYFKAITSAIPVDYHIFPQINLASFIDRTDNARYRNELFRNVDFLITDSEYAPKIVVEVNDQTHLERDRRERDEKVAKICEEAGIPIIKLWTSYGVQPDYIQKRISEQLAALPIKRIHHFDVQNGAPHRPLPIPLPTLRSRAPKKAATSPPLSTAHMTAPRFGCCADIATPYSAQNRSAWRL